VPRGRTLAAKLGIKEHCEVVLLGAPEGYRERLQPLPASVRFAAAAGGSTNIVQLFVTQRSDLARELAVYRKTLSPQATVWVSWPKKASRVATDLTEDIVRDLALPLGFVDVKVCAVDDVWSGLRLVVRRALR
jgi:hypothetical protein